MTILLALAQALDYATASREAEQNPVVQCAMDLGISLGAKAALVLFLVSVIVVRERRPGVARFVAAFGIVAGLVGAASNVA